MYCCNDCGEKFEEPNEGLCPKCGSGDIFEEATENTMEEVVAEADEKNKKGFAASLREFGEQYIQYQNSLERAKLCIKDVFEMAEDKGITKDMILSYAAAIKLDNFNAKVLCSAVQQELGFEEPETEEVNDVQQEEQSDSKGDE